jgi:hypothetical protein
LVLLLHHENLGYPAVDLIHCEIRPKFRGNVVLNLWDGGWCSRVWVSTRDEKNRKPVRLKFYHGQKGAKRTPGNWHDPKTDLPEQTIYRPARVSKGVMEFEINLDEAVKMALGSQGWMYSSAINMRLRGNLSISPIKFAV